MPLQNRVTPAGDIVAVEARGTMMGNRGGALHRPDRSLRRRRWVTRQWIACRLEFKERHREVMAANRYTELFFLDEATALAAGHRPCFECRRTDALHFARLWADVRGQPDRAAAQDMDAVLHAERLMPDGSKRTCERSVGELPAGTMIMLGDVICAVARGGGIVPWSHTGYRSAKEWLPAHRRVKVLTPPSIVAVMQAGFALRMHSTWPDHRNSR